MGQDHEEKKKEREQKLSAIAHVGLYLVTLAISATLLSSTYSAFAKGLEIQDDKKQLEEKLDKLNARLSVEEKMAIIRLDPDYSEAEKRRDENRLLKGEELLPIYEKGWR